MNAAATPRLTDHARERCAQMGISTKRAKRIVTGRTMTYRGSRGNTGMVCMSADPDFSCVWDPAANLIITVVPRTGTDYTRDTTSPAGYTLAATA